MGVPRLLDELERFLKPESAKPSLITASIAKRLSDIAAFGELFSRQTQHQPKIRMPDDYDASQAAIKKRLAIIETISQKLRQDSRLRTFAAPLLKFDYPLQRKRNEQNTELMRTVEATLDAFWEYVDGRFLDSRTPTNPLHDLIRNRMAIRVLERTPPWQAPLAAARPKPSSQPKPNPAYREDSNSQEQAPELSLPAKAKAKTRGEADTVKGEVPTVEAEESPAPRQTFHLAPRALKVARALYPLNIQDHTPGKVRWQDLINLMSELKFSIRKHDGSEWYFEPAWMPDIPITIHEPHPANEIPVVHLRRHARRLQDRYRWTNATFVPA